MTDSIYSKFYLSKERKTLFLSEAEVAYIQYSKFRINLIDGKKSSLDYHDFFKELDELDLDKIYENAIVIHLFYEASNYFVEIDQGKDDEPLAIYIEYKKAKLNHLNVNSEYTKPLKLKILEAHGEDAYRKNFNRVYKHLLAGDCYQLNLTSQYIFKLLDKDVSADELFSRLWSQKEKIGSYSHGTYIDSLGKLFLSNSPECLFQIKQSQKKKLIRTMPIKGTIACSETDSLKKKWIDLRESIKDEGELNMITDLMRNDLTKISMNPSKVIKKKLFLKVPGILHQLSLLETQLAPNDSLLSVLKGIFPGGSITGAPKRNVIKLIQKIENRTRGFYCGSTILLYQHLKTASINIRSAEIDFTTMELAYGTGGGITLLSDAKTEYEETLHKLESFISTIQ